MGKSPVNARDKDTGNVKEYLKIIRNNLVSILLITVSWLAIAIAYAINAPDIYKSTTVIKVSKPQGSVLNSPLMPDFQDFGSDRFIANEIEILKSYTVREKVARSLITDYGKSTHKERFNIILNEEPGFSSKKKQQPKSVAAMVEMFRTLDIEQKRGLDIVEISVESPSPFEAALIANTYAAAYNELNLQNSRKQLTQVKDFLASQCGEKQKELVGSEENLRLYQQAGGIVALDEQARSLIDQLSKFEAARSAAKIDLTITSRNLAQYKEVLKKQDPLIADYLESFATEPYLKTLQESIARLETQRDIAMTNKAAEAAAKGGIADYDARIQDLKARLTGKMQIYKAGIFASSPEEIKQLTRKIMEEEIRTQAAKTSVEELSNIVYNYDQKFNLLPAATIEYARRERERAAMEKLYLLVEEKYQEALINEQAQPGNVLMIDTARIPPKPAKPNRILIIIIGLVLGMVSGVGFSFVRNYFDNTVKTPEDIERRNINVLAWIPQIEGINMNVKGSEFIVARKPDSIPAEAFRALRTRVQFSKFDKSTLRTLLVTSSAPQEGKTTVSVNLAGSFARTGKRTIIVDCDLRKPRLHNVFMTNRYPGFTDYFFGQAGLSDIIVKTEMNNLDFVPSGTIPPNPSEILGSVQMEEFLALLRHKYDMILLDSPPIIAVTDSEIISRIVDASILVVSANTTEIDLMQKSVSLLTHERNTFIGVVLNNFSFKGGYGSYYKYYYYYSRPKDGERILKKTAKV